MVFIGNNQRRSLLSPLSLSLSLLLGGVAFHATRKPLVWVGGCVPQKHMRFGVGIGVWLCFLSLVLLFLGVWRKPESVCLLLKSLLLFSKRNKLLSITTTICL